MSLDYIFVKSFGSPKSIEEIVTDPDYRKESYRALAQKFIPFLNWIDCETAFVSIDGTSIEINARDASLGMYLRGYNVNPNVLFAFIEDANNEGVVLIDVQSSTIVEDIENDKNAPAYIKWYRSILDNH